MSDRAKAPGKRQGPREGGRRPVPSVPSRRRQPNGFPRVVRRTVRGWNGLLELPAVWVVLLVVVGGWALTPGGLLPAPAIDEGQIATRDYVAPDDLLIPDEGTTLEKQERAREEVAPVYDYDSAAAADVDRRLARLFEEGRRVTAEREVVEPDELASAVASASGLEVTPEQVDALSDQGFGPDLEERVRMLAERALRRGVVEGKTRLLENRIRGVTLRDLRTGRERQHFDLYDHLDHPEELQEYLEAEVADWLDLSAEERFRVVELLVENVPPNLSSNRSATLERQEAAAEAVAPVFQQIRKGQVIVRKGDQIGAAEARTIGEATGRHSVAGRVLPVGATLLLLGLAAIVLWPGLARERVADHSRRRLYSEVLLLLLVSLLGAKFTFLVSSALANSFDAAPFDSFRSYAYGVPFAALAMMAALLFSRTAAALLAFVFSILVSRLAGPDALWVTLYAAVGSLGAVYAVDAFQIRQRLALTRVGLLVGGLNLVSVLALTGFEAGLRAEPFQLLFDGVCAFGGGLLVAAVGSFSIPILEATLGITTDIKLVELANANLPLLRRLAFEAPGTFQHSLMVANLAKEGCEAIDADPVLAYTGGLYHDVGKIHRPQYFVENQRSGQNPHDKLTPSMSALVLTSHVKDGLELADRHHLPQPVRDVIAQHHGTRLITFFYNRAREQAGGTRKQAIAEEKYRYPGPRPQDKVMAVLMLADGVEAASRTLTEPSELKIRTLVHKIFDDCLEDGQLDESDLTLADLRKVARAFVRVLTNIFHQRIDYPGYDFRGGAVPPVRRERTAAAVVRAS